MAICTASDRGANHQDDVHDFFDALAAGKPVRGQLPQGTRLPGRPRRLFGSAARTAVPRQHRQCDRGSRFWRSTAIIIMYDDSDGWYIGRWARSLIPRRLPAATPRTRINSMVPANTGTARGWPMVAGKRSRVA